MRADYPGNTEIMRKMKRTFQNTMTHENFLTLVDSSLSLPRGLSEYSLGLASSIDAAGEIEVLAVL